MYRNIIIIYECIDCCKNVLCSVQNNDEYIFYSRSRCSKRIRRPRNTCTAWAVVPRDGRNGDRRRIVSFPTRFRFTRNKISFPKGPNNCQGFRVVRLPTSKCFAEPVHHSVIISREYVLSTCWRKMYSPEMFDKHNENFNAQQSIYNLLYETTFYFSQIISH